MEIPEPFQRLDCDHRWITVSDPFESAMRGRYLERCKKCGVEFVNSGEPLMDFFDRRFERRHEEGDQ